MTSDLSNTLDDVSVLFHNESCDTCTKANAIWAAAPWLMWTRLQFQIWYEKFRISSRIDPSFWLFSPSLSQVPQLRFTHSVLLLLFICLSELFQAIHTQCISWLLNVYSTTQLLHAVWSILRTDLDDLTCWTIQDRYLLIKVMHFLQVSSMSAFNIFQGEHDIHRLPLWFLPN